MSTPTPSAAAETPAERPAETSAGAPAGPPPATPRKRKRGFEGAGDMVRSLVLVLVPVVVIWFFAQPGPDAEQTIRPVDQTGDVQAWQATASPAPVPRAPQEWTPTVSQLLPQPTGLRLGWNTDGGRYAEFAATTGPAGPFVEDLVGTAPEEDTVEVGGATWRRFVEADGSVSLVRTFGSTTVVVGTERATAPEDELTALAATVS